MTPHHLHATAAAWSLQAARGHLHRLSDDEAAQIAAEQLEAPAVLRSAVWGGRHALGGHGDPTPGRLATADRPARRNRWAEMADRLDGKLRWLTGQIPKPRSVLLMMAGGMYEPLELILVSLPSLQPGTAAVLARHLADEDRWIREAIGVGAVRAPIIGVPCPGCDRRDLYVQVAGPEATWTVVCAAGCRCVGHGCGCGMDGAVEGVAHIWPRCTVITAAESPCDRGPTCDRPDHQQTERASTPGQPLPPIPACWSPPNAMALPTSTERI